MKHITDPQPEPKRNKNKAVWDAVILDMQERNQFGIKKYGTPLQPFNGRDALIDAYQEALDLCVYLKQAIMERDEVKPQESNTFCPHGHDWDYCPVCCH